MLRMQKQMEMLSMLCYLEKGREQEAARDEYDKVYRNVLESFVQQTFKDWVDELKLMDDASNLGQRLQVGLLTRLLLCGFSDHVVSFLFPSVVCHCRSRPRELVSVSYTCPHRGAKVGSPVLAGQKTWRAEICLQWWRPCARIVTSSRRCRLEPP